MASDKPNVEAFMHLRTVDTVMALQNLSPLSPISYIRKCRKLGCIRIIYVGNVCTGKRYATQCHKYIQVRSRGFDMREV
jgi:hypothetical protein